MSALPPIHRWEVRAPRALVHVVHGMGEYGARYARLAATLNAAHCTVWAHDHRGHGDHMLVEGGRRLAGHFGDYDGWRCLIDDTLAASRQLQESAPATPLILFAHSMGSFVAQAILAEAGDRYAGVVLSGSNGAPDTLEKMAGIVAPLERRVRGPRTPSRWMHQLLLRTYNRPFTPSRTELDWLSRDQAEVDAFAADPRRTAALTTQAWVDFLQGKRALGRPHHLARIPKALPLRIISGDRDPVGAMGAGVRRLHELYVRAGLTVSLQVYPGARHELVNETNRDDVTRDLLRWLEEIIAA